MYCVNFNNKKISNKNSNATRSPVEKLGTEPANQNKQQQNACEKKQNLWKPIIKGMIIFHSVALEAQLKLK